MLKSLLYIVVFWVVWRWLDRLFGRKGWRSNRRESQQKTPNQSSQASTKKPNDDRIGDYVEFEEVEE
ncbi:MAG: hypothetical protein P8L80_01575 [Flavobacteriales bacterium]|jgi:hypothetical protein|nr:hypothetical protein [Flavobacteriales bacterium]|tara:strand:- start:115 stop:315 length:201 start_codon:yes stop_codon:yes gene_type:complete